MICVNRLMGEDVLTPSWIVFVFCMVSVFLILIVPGYVALSGSSIDRFDRVSYAPFVSIFLVFCVGTLLYFVSVPTSWWQLLSIVFVLAAIVSRVSSRLLRLTDGRAIGKERNGNRSDLFLLLLYIVVGCLVMLIFFVRTLDGPGSFVALYDNAYHLNLIRSFSSAGYYSPLGAMLDLKAGAAISGISFYPAMLHALSALIVSLFSVTPAFAMNSVLAVFIGVVFPTGCFSLIRKVSDGDRIVCFYGAFIALAFGAFPWRFLQWGPLYPNAISYALIPGFVASFIFATEARNEKLYRRILLAFTGIAAMAVTQTNADFTAAVILIPFVFNEIYGSAAATSKKKSVLLCLCFIVFVVALWLFLYLLPPLSAVVSYTWAPVSSTSQAIVNVITLAFTGGMTQPILSGAVIVGLLAMLVKKPGKRWIVASYCLLSTIYLLSSSATGMLQHLFAGFWYTDSNRTAASVVLVAIPIAAFGFAELHGLIARYAKQADSELLIRFLPVVATACVTCMIYLPNHYVAGFGNVATSFGAIGDDLTRLNMLSADFSLTKDEIQFAEQVNEIIEPEAVVLNNPFDGSVFLYSNNNLNTFFKSFIAFDEDDSADTDTERILRRYASNYTSRPEVADMMKECGIQYVIQLDAEGWGSSTSTYDNNYSERFETYFNGIQNIDENTPGFSLVLSSGDMRLYKVDY